MRDDRNNALRLHKSTQGLDDAQLSLLAKHVEIVRCDAGDVIHRPDDLMDALLLVIAGRLTTSVVSSTGVPTAFQQIGLDDQFGLLLLESDTPLPVLLTADQNTKLLRIPRDAAVQLLTELPLWRRNLFRSVGPRLLETVSNTKRPANSRVIVFVHMTNETRELSRVLVQRLSQLGEKITLLSDREAASDHPTSRTESLLDSGGRLKTSEEIRDLVARWPNGNRVILDGDFSTFATRLSTIADGAGAVYWVCPNESVAPVSAALKSLVNSSPARKEKLFVIRIVGHDEQSAQLAPELASFCTRDFKVHWSAKEQDSVCSQREGVERIIHHLRGATVGLALGGGAARGMAHLGVLQVLQEAGVVIDRMAGTSAGALTGVLYAAGYSAPFQMDSFARDLKPPWHYRMLPYGDALYLLGKYRLGGWNGMLRKYLGSWHLEQLAIPFSTVAADLVQAKTVIRETGDATHAILESINLPGLSQPICRNGMALVDGGIFNVVPADVLASQEAQVVIASDVAARIRPEFAGNRPGTPTSKMQTPSSFQTAVRVRNVQDRNLCAVGGRAADIVIEPDVSQVKLTDFKLAHAIAKLGREAAEAALPEIRRTLHALDAQLFPVPNSADWPERSAA
jgi:NTE family protein